MNEVIASTLMSSRVSERFEALLADPAEMKEGINRIKARITKLEQLGEAYIEGKDIVQTRLQMD